MSNKQREALEAALYEVQNYLAAWRAGAKADTNGLQLLIPKIEAALAEPEQDFCFCNSDISLQSVAGGASLGGLYSEITVKIGDSLVKYHKAATELTGSPQPREWQELKVGNIETIFYSTETQKFHDTMKRHKRIDTNHMQAIYDRISAELRAKNGE